MESKALKKFGQNFLKNKIKLKEIADTAEISASDVIIEIGPGHGELTEEIRKQKTENRIIAIEKDKNLVLSLRRKFGSDKNIEITEGDALRILPKLINNHAILQSRNYKLVGNIPYYITGHLFRIISELENKPKLLVFTVQKEVAERICAKSGEMNLLAASIELWAKPEIISYIPKEDFEPQPKVDSAVIRLTTYGQWLTAEELGKCHKFIHLLFKQPRKTIFNNLRPMTKNPQFIEEKLESSGINPKSRPQDISIKQIIQLAKIFN